MGATLRSSLQLVALAGWVLLVLSTLPYFDFAADSIFFAERDPISETQRWQLSFYVHDSGGIVCLGLGPLLAWNLLTRRSRQLHRLLGWIYVFTVLGWAAPTGLYLSLHARGGLAGQFGFLLTDLLWILATWVGLGRLKRGQTREHAIWMLRSYALTLSAIFFRILHLVFFYAGLGDDWNYLASIWLSLALSLLAGERFGQPFHRFSSRPLVASALFPSQLPSTPTVGGTR